MPQEAKKRIFFVLIGLIMAVGQFVILAPNEVWGQPDDSELNASGDTILAFTSDVHNKTSDISADRLAGWIDAVQGNYGKIDAMGFCGDMGDAGDRNYFWENVKVVMDTVSNKGVDGIYTTGNHEFNPGDAQCSEGVLTSKTSQAVLDNFKVDSVGKVGDNYIIYCLGSFSYNQGYSPEEWEALGDFLMSTDNDKPIIVITHFPLHRYRGPHKEKGRATENASRVIETINRAAVNQTPDDPTDDRTIVLLWGHNHTDSDKNYDQVYVPGDSIEYTDGSWAKIQFYYGAAGCMSDEEYSAGSASVEGKGLVLQIRADDSIGFAYCNEAGEDVTEEGDYPKIVTEPKPAEGLRFDKSSLTVREGWTEELTAIFEPLNATDKNLTWTISPESVAAITSAQGNNGTSVKIKGVSEGTAVITAKSEDGDFTAEAEVTVTGTDDEQYYVIRTGDKAMSNLPSAAEAKENNQKYSYRGLECAPYPEGTAVPCYLLWTLEPAEEIENGYYIRSYSGKYLSASYKKTKNGESTSILTVGRTKDIWIIGEDPDNWDHKARAIRSTNASPTVKGNYLKVVTGNQGNDTDFFTIRSRGDRSVLVRPETIEEHQHTIIKVGRVKPTTKAEGTEAYWTCNVCGMLFSDANGRNEIAQPARIPKLKSAGTAVGKGATAAAAETAITSMKNDSDPAGSVFSKLKLKSTKQSKKTITLNWTKTKGAVKYVIYGNRCGKANKMKKIAAAKTNKYVVKKAVKKLVKGKYYKFIVVALDKKNNVISTSKVIHVATAGTKAGNYKSVKVSKKVIAKAKKIKKGKSLRLKAKLKKASKKKAAKHRGLKYETTNKKIATVSAKGVVKAKKKGTCYVFAYAQNGVFKRIKIIVR